MRRVVITGMGIISPVGNNITDFWANLTAGVCGIAPITRFDASGFKAKLAAEVKDFTPADYGIEPQSLRRMDIYTQYAVAAASQAVGESGIIGSIDPQRLGVYVGSGIGGMHTFVAEAERMAQRGPSRVSPLFIPMMIGNIAAGVIAIKYGAGGPCLSVVTACATSTHSIGEAYRAVAGGFADAIIAGGAEAAIEPLAIAGFINCQALSLSQDPSAASIPFDARRSGFVMGEGAGVLVLEELDRALARGAKIYAEVAGYANTCDAYHITAPRPDGADAARAIALAAREAGIGGDDSLYINAHGTGTPLNDSVESRAIELALADAVGRAAVSSTKSMTGHMLGAAGAAEAIASALTLKNGVAPPTINYREPDPECRLDYIPNMKREGDYTHALSISLGFGGHNACLALRRFGG